MTTCRILGWNSTDSTVFDSDTICLSISTCVVVDGIRTRCNQSARKCKSRDHEEHNRLRMKVDFHIESLRTCRLKFTIIWTYFSLASRKAPRSKSLNDQLRGSTRPTSTTRTEIEARGTSRRIATRLYVAEGNVICVDVCRINYSTTHG